MASEIVRRIDDLGRIVIPKAIRESLGIQEGDPLEIEKDGDRLIITKYGVTVEDKDGQDNA